MKKANKSKKRKILILLILCISLIVIIYSSIHIVMWILDTYDNKKEFDQIEKKVNITEVTNTEISPDEIMIDENEILENDPYWHLIKMNYLQVDFSHLIETNSETVAWLFVPNTNINYPVVQHLDNNYYLNHSFSGNNNEAGWIFMDYRNSIETLDKNTIVYGHTRKDGSMFGTLGNSLNHNWYENESNYAIRTSSKSENSIWQVFSVYCIPTTSDYIQTDFSDNATFENFLHTIKSRSIYDFKTTVNIKNKILTLSTCHNRNERIVMHAKLIKSQTKK